MTARMIAYTVLRDVDERDAYANLALPARIRAARASTRDAALATQLVAGTLRYRARYDRIIELAARRSITQIDAATLRVLRLGAHQLLALRVADHAAVHESVELQRRVANPAAAGFVNAVLRAIGRVSNAAWNARIEAHAANDDEALATLSSHPAWVVRAFRAALTAEGRAAELGALLAANNEPPRVSIALLTDSVEDRWPNDASTEEALALAGCELTAHGPSPIGVELAGGDPSVALGVLQRYGVAARVQDQGSQLAALVLSRARPVRAGERWLDLCAGPGGKTAVLAGEAARGGATLRATEVSAHRAELVRQATAAYDVEVAQHDGRSAAAFAAASRHEHADGYDRILVDAPCSGLGALRRRPEARWRKQPEDLPQLTRLQRQLFDAAATHLRPGGLLAYVTCSPHLAETAAVLADMRSQHPQLRQRNTPEIVRSLARVPLDLAGEALHAQLWPHRHGTDAMAIALFERVA